MKKLILIISLLTLVTSCKSKTLDIKSPCVSLEDGPCGPKKPINDWWLKGQQGSNKNSVNS